MLDSRQIEAAAADDGEVRGMWMKSVRSLGSSRVAGLDADSAFTLAYRGALQAATAILRAAGFQARGDGHHHHTFAAVAALELGELSDAARDLNIVRQRRHRAIYDWEASVQETDLLSLRSAADRLVERGRVWLQEQRPALELPKSGRYLIPPRIRPAEPRTLVRGYGLSHA
jgi:hypothetical protein